MNQENDEKSRKRLDEEAKNKRNILINRIVTIVILSSAFFLGFWGLWKYKNTTNKMEAELIEIELKREAKRKTIDLIDKAKTSKQSGRYEEALGFYEEAKSLSPDLPNIDRLIKDIKKKIEEERRVAEAEKKEEERRKKAMDLIDKAKTSELTGKYKEALRLYKEAKSLSPDIADIDELIAEVEKKIEKNDDYEKEQETLANETKSEDKEEEYIDIEDQIRSKIKIIQRKLNDLMEQHIDTGKSISSMDMRTDSSEIADLEAERKILAKKIKENNIQKEQLLDELTVKEKEELRLDDGHNVAGEKELKASWLKWQHQLEVAYNEGLKHDKDSSLSTNEKIENWQHVVQNFNYDNPYSTEDESMRSHAMDRVEYWKNLSKKRKPQPSISLSVKNVKLRSSRSRDLSKGDVKEMLEKYNFYDSIWNKDGYFTNDYEAKVINGDRVVIDHATGLMWHQSGSLQTMDLEKAKRWVRELNRQRYTGYRNWRLPTVEEAVTLLESSEYGGRKGLYIDPVFDSRQNQIWTRDEKAKKEKLAKWLNATVTSSNRYWWRVDFTRGTVSWLIKLSDYNYVRPVRTMR